MRVKGGKLVVKNIRTNKMWEFGERWEAAWFVGTSLGEMERILKLYKDEAMRYYVGGEQYVIICDGRERPPTLGKHIIEPMDGYAEVVSSTGGRERFDSYISVANHLGLLVRHVMEEGMRSREGKPSKEYVNDEGVFTIEFGKEEVE